MYKNSHIFIPFFLGGELGVHSD